MYIHVSYKQKFLTSRVALIICIRRELTFMKLKGKCLVVVGIACIDYLAVTTGQGDSYVRVHEDLFNLVTF